MKANHSFTIHTELINGTLAGGRNIYLGANSTCHLYVIPRDEISLVNSITDIVNNPAFYILLGEKNHHNPKPEAYIGQTTDFANRKNDHMQKKDFWTIALVFVSDNHKIYGDDVKYLEFLGIEAAQLVGAYNLLNGANPKKPNIAPYRINDMEVFFRDIQLLTRFYGCGIFDAPVVMPEARHLFYIKSTEREAYGEGYYNENDDKFVVLKGSKFAATNVKSYASVNARNAFLAEHCKNEKGVYILKYDYTFDTPSGASGYLLGRPSNGWSDWKDTEGNKLEMLKRK